MGSLLLALPVICCLLIPAAAFVIWGLRNRSPDQDGRQEKLTHPIERDRRN